MTFWSFCETTVAVKKRQCITCLSPLSHKLQDFRKTKIIRHKMCALIFSAVLCNSCLNIYHSTRIDQDIIINVHFGLHVKNPLFSRILSKLELSRQIFENPQISNLMKTRPVGAGFFHAEGRTDMTQLIFSFRKFCETHQK